MISAYLILQVQWRWRVEHGHRAHERLCGGRSGGEVSVAGSHTYIASESSMKME